MSDNNVVRAKDAKSNLGLWGWGIVILGALGYFITSGVQNEGSNLLLPAYEAATGVSTATLYTLGTITGWIVIPLAYLMGRFLAKKGARTTLFVFWLVSAAGIAIMGISHSAPMYLIGRILTNGGGNGALTMAFASLVTNWFPSKKDIVQGYATIGCNLATAFTLILISFLLKHFTITGTYLFLAGFEVVLAFLSLAFHNNPEEIGHFPDNDENMTREQAQELLRRGEEYKKNSPWTTKKLLKTKQTWQIAIGYGFIMLITVGILSTLITTLTLKGVDQSTAVGTMTVAAIIAMPCSALWGVLAAKITTKKASLLLYVVAVLAVVFMMVPGKWSMYVVIPLIGCFLGAGNNLTPSMIGSIFGRYDFASAMAVIIPFWNCVSNLGGTVVGVPQALTGSYTLSYVLLLIIAVIGFIMIATLDDRLIGRADTQEE